MSRQERAQQVAIEVGLKHGWDGAGIELLAEVFHLHWWSAARRSMERELAAGMTPEELRLALAVREIWRTHLEFSTDFTSVSPYSSGGVTADRYHVLSWPQALGLVRSFEGYPGIEEIEAFLEELFDEWYVDHQLHRVFGSFMSYVYYRTATRDDVAPQWPSWTFAPDESLNPSPDDADDTNTPTRVRGTLFRDGLLQTPAPSGPLPLVDPQARR